MRGLKDIYKFRWKQGIILMTPALLIMLWLSWETLEKENNYRKAVGPLAPAWSISLFQLALHDVLEENTRHLKWKTPQTSWPVLDLSISSKNIQKLLSPVQVNPLEKNYAKALIQLPEQKLKAKIRLRGGKHWHHMDTKKSLKVRLDKGALYQNQRDFNLSNLHKPFFIANPLLLNLAKSQGILSTESQFTQVKANGVDWGVFHFDTRPTELTLRQNKRFPGTIYTLDHLSDKAQKSAWAQAGQWEQLSGKDIEPMRLDLRRLLTALSHLSESEFRSFAMDEINLTAFARLEAFNLLFGEEKQNFALYFDHYRFQWEPILYETDAFHHEKKLKLSQNPLFKALDKLPEYLKLRQDFLNSFLETLSPETIEQKAKSLAQKTLPLLENDPDWKAIKLLPYLNTYYRQKMRPMSSALFAKFTKHEIDTYRTRFQWIKKQKKTLPFISKKNNEALKIGPGKVHFSQSRLFHAHQSIEILAGTQIEMAPGTSLIFKGPVYFRGTAQAPVVIQPMPKGDPWGGIAIQGPATQGSYLKHVNISGGTTARWNERVYPGMLNIHDTQKITLEHSLFHHNRYSDDLIHMVYVNDFRVSNNRIESAFSDAIDIEFSKGIIDHLYVNLTGDDGLDLMASKIELHNSYFLNCLGNGISAGEESMVQAKNILIAQSEVGILSKNASTVHIKDSLIYKNKSGLSIHQFSPHYANKSQFFTHSLALVKNKKELKKDTFSTPYIHLKNKRNDFKGNIKPLKMLLKLSDWNQLEPWIKKQTGASHG